MIGLHTTLFILAAIAGATIGPWIVLFVQDKAVVMVAVPVLCLLITMATAALELSYGGQGSGFFIAGYVAAWLAAFVPASFIALAFVE